MLREFEALSEIVLNEVAALVLERGQEEPAEMAALFVQLHRAMSQIGLVAVETYQEVFLGERQRLAERLSSFAATLEHEVRGPLQAATSSAELLGQEQVAEDAERRDRYVGIIRERLQRVSQLIDDVRELSVAEQALTREGRKLVRAAIQDIFEEVAPLAERNGVRLEIAEPLPEIRVDTARVEVALMNVINNAVKYADPAKPERWVRVSLQPTGSPQDPGWQILIEDNGLGIPRGFERHVFQRRARAHPAVADGTGLGLYIVREIMEQGGGAVRLETEEGAGSTFILELTPRLAEFQKVSSTDQSEE